MTSVPKCPQIPGRSHSCQGWMPGPRHVRIATSPRLILVVAAWVIGTGVSRAAWDTPENGNPILPGYFADPSIFFDSASSQYLVYATTDGNWISYSSEPTVWSTTDFVHWKSSFVSLPSSWPTSPLWAPSIIKHPTNGRYYLIYADNGGTFIASANSPLGPWSNATSGTTTSTAPLYASGSMWGGGDGIDAQFFLDGNTVYMTFGGGGHFGIARLAFATNGLASIDNSDARMTDGTTHKYKSLDGIQNALEGSCMFKNGSTYFLTFSNNACQNYNVQYAYASSPVGPFTSADGQIVARDNAKGILGPGHHSVLQVGSTWYICYHRQHYQYVDVKRQICMNQITINGNSISTGVQTQEGIGSGTGALEALVAAARAKDETDLAFGKTVLASSESDYKGGTGNWESFDAIPHFYAARYAVDHNNGTLWSPSTLPGNLIVDLGANYFVGRCETTFEYVLRTYRYKIDYLSASEAANLAQAQASTAWHPYADRSANTQKLSPVVDSLSTTARYLRLTVLAADIPTAADEINTILQTDYADRIGVFEFKVFAPIVTIPAHRDSVFNGGFGFGSLGWTFNTWGGTATGSVVNDEYKIQIDSIGQHNSSIQLVQNGIILERGKSYEVKFDAYASSNRTLETNVEQDVNPWTSYLPALQNFDLTTTKTTYSYAFTMTNTTDSNGRVSFNVGASTETVYLDNVSIKSIPVGVHTRACPLERAMLWSAGALLIPGTETGKLQIVDPRGQSRFVDVAGGKADIGHLPSGLYQARVLGAKSDAGFHRFIVIP